MSSPATQRTTYILGINADSPSQPHLLVRWKYNGEESWSSSFNGELPTEGDAEEAIAFASQEAAERYIYAAKVIHESDWTYALWIPPEA